MKALLLGLTLGTLIVPTFAAAARVQFNGSGCPLTGPAEFYWDDGELVIQLVDMNLSKGQGEAPSEARKNCALTLDPGLNQRWNITALRVRGFTDLASGDELSLRFDRFIQGDGELPGLKFSAFGPQTYGFDFQYELRPNEQVWTSCSKDRALTLNSSLLLKGDRETAAQAQLEQLRFRIKASRCP